MKRRTGTFMVDGNDGRSYTIYIYTDFINAGTLDDPRAEIEGLKELRTSDGKAVNRLSKGEYQVVQTGVILRSSESDAP